MIAESERRAYDIICHIMAHKGAINDELKSGENRNGDCSKKVYDRANQEFYQPDVRINIEDTTLDIYRVPVRKYNERIERAPKFVNNVKVFYKNIEVCTISVIPTYVDWELTSLEWAIVDGYGRREDSRHDLSKVFQWAIDLLDKRFYTPYLDAVEKQKLYRDTVLDEFNKMLSNL